MFLNNSYAHILKEKDVPVPVKAAFHKVHPNIYVVSWTQQDNNYKVEYTINKVNISNTYEATGKLVNIETDILISTLPVVIGAYVKANYNNSGINQAFRINDKNGLINYKISLIGKSLLFDSRGSFIEESKL